MYLLRHIYGRETLPNPDIIATINTGRLGTQEEEVNKLKALPANATDEERQAALYSIMLADLKKEYILPKFNPGATRRRPQ
jgi:hypothetical protein